MADVDDGAAAVLASARAAPREAVLAAVAAIATQAPLASSDGGHQGVDLAAREATVVIRTPPRRDDDARGLVAIESHSPGGSLRLELKRGYESGGGTPGDVANESGALSADEAAGARGAVANARPPPLRRALSNEELNAISSSVKVRRRLLRQMREMDRRRRVAASKGVPPSHAPTQASRRAPARVAGEFEDVAHLLSSISRTAFIAGLRPLYVGAVDELLHYTRQKIVHRLLEERWLSEPSMDPRRRLPKAIGRDRSSRAAKQSQKQTQPQPARGDAESKARSPTTVARLLPAAEGAAPKPLNPRSAASQATKPVVPLLALPKPEGAAAATAERGGSPLSAHSPHHSPSGSAPRRSLSFDATKHVHFDDGVVHSATMPFPVSSSPWVGLKSAEAAVPAPPPPPPPQGSVGKPLPTALASPRTDASPRPIIVRHGSMETWDDMVARLFREREAKNRELLRTLQRGTWANLYCGDPRAPAQRVFLLVSEDGMELAWNAEEKRARAAFTTDSGLSRLMSSLFKREKCERAELADATEVKFGAEHTDAFNRFIARRGKPWQCLTLRVGDRALHLQFESEREACDWFLGLQSQVPMTAAFVSLGKFLWMKARMKTVDMARCRQMTVVDAVQSLFDDAMHKRLSRAGSASPQEAPRVLAAVPRSPSSSNA
jgi:hypothetical protein